MSREQLSQDRPVASVAKWANRARTMAKQAEQPGLEIFLGIGGDALRSASEATRGVAWNKALLLITRVLLRRAAEFRGLVEKSETTELSLEAAATWSSKQATTTDPVMAPLFEPYSLESPGLHQAVAGLRGCLREDSQAPMLGALFENLLAKMPRYRERRGWILEHSSRRRTQGVFFTPPPAIRFLVRTALGPVAERCRDAQDVLHIRVVDPAVGAGFFLLEALDLLANSLRVMAPEMTPLNARRQVAQACLAGVDVDAGAVALARALIWLRVGDPLLEPASVAPLLVPGDALTGPPIPGQDGERLENDDLSETGVDWGAQFPGVFDAQSPRGRSGFDVVISNPPWGRFRPEIKAFHLQYDEDLKDFQGDSLRAKINRLEVDDGYISAAWEKHKAARLAMARNLRANGAYAAQSVLVQGRRTGGDSDAYKYFLERSVHLLHSTGRLGLVLPEAWLRTEGATGLRRLLFDRGQVEKLLCFENRERHFPIHAMFRYSLLCWQKGGKSGIRSAKFGLKSLKHVREHESMDNGGPSFSEKWMKSFGGPLMLLPAVKTPRDKELFAKLVAAFPPLGSQESGPWRVRFVRELDITNDRSLFLTADLLESRGWQRTGVGWKNAEGKRAFPLYEGRMVHQHDHAAKGYRGGGGRKAKWVPLPLERKALESHYWVIEEDVREKVDALEAARAGFCDITGHANERTAIAALIPARCPAGNKVPTLRFNDPDPRLHLIWVALANSFIIDWLLRRLVDTTVNFFHWKQIPFPRLDPSGGKGEALWSMAAELASIEQSHASFLRDLKYSRFQGTDTQQRGHDWHSRARLRAHIDAIAAELFEVGPEELSLILRDFSLLDRNQPPLPGEPASTITQDLLLLTVHERAGTVRSEDVQALSCRVQRAEALGAAAYVPSEHART